MPTSIRNIAIIAHVDHGKTTLVDKLLRQAGVFAAHQQVTERVMDSNDLERERGITILAKNAAVEYRGVKINIVDTPGHRDFGGEVERALSMVDGVLVLVDAVEGPMPQTRFVTKKALALGLRPIVVVNKVDRDGARAEWAVSQTFDLFDRLGAAEDQLDFPVVYASALQGWAVTELADAPSTREELTEANLLSGPSMRALFEAILTHVSVPDVDPDGPCQLRISALDYSSYVGRMGIGRINRGRLHPGQEIVVLAADMPPVRARIGQVHGFRGLERVELDAGIAGDIVVITGVEEVSIGATLADPEHPQALPVLAVDEPTLTMNFQVNTSPFAGQEGRYVTSRQLAERLARELNTNVALRVEETPDPDIFRILGRGELHLTILLENMRREGYELCVGRPEVITRVIDGVPCEPFEALTIDVENTHQGAAMEALGSRRAELTDMAPDGKGRVRLEYRIPARGLIGFQNEFLNLTRGTGLMSHVFDEYAPMKPDIPGRRSGVLISGDDGQAVAYALGKLQERGRLFVKPGDRVYQGMVIGIHSRENDLSVNPVKAKQLTNFRTVLKDDAILLTPPIPLTLEYGVEFIADDELVEITPKSIRIRKRYLKEHERKRAARDVERAV
jgi:GTP-binding protein